MLIYNRLNGYITQRHINHSAEFVRLKKEVDDDLKNILRENMKKSTVELLLKMQGILEKNGGDFMVGNRVSQFLKTIT